MPNDTDQLRQAFEKWAIEKLIIRTADFPTYHAEIVQRVYVDLLGKHFDEFILPLWRALDKIEECDHAKHGPDWVVAKKAKADVMGRLKEKYGTI